MKKHHKSNNFSKSEICNLHQEKKKIFCKLDEEFCCSTCVIEKHQNHQTDLENISTLAEDCKKKCKIEKKNLKKILNNFENSLLKINKQNDIITKTHENLNNEIEIITKDLIQKIEERKKKILNDLKKIEQNKILKLNLQKNFFLIAIENFENFLINLNLDDENETFIISIHNKLEKFLSNFLIENKFFNPIVDEKLKYDLKTEKENLVEEIENFIKIIE
jgi:hypothetical protein